MVDRLDVTTFLEGILDDGSYDLVGIDDDELGMGQVTGESIGERHQVGVEETGCSVHRLEATSAPRPVCLHIGIAPERVHRYQHKFPGT